MYFWIMLISLLSCMVQTQDTSLGSTTAVDPESVVVLMASVPKAASHDDSTGEMIVLRHEQDRCFGFYLNRFGRLSTGSIKIEHGDSFPVYQPPQKPRQNIRQRTRVLVLKLLWSATAMNSRYPQQKESASYLKID